MISQSSWPDYCEDPWTWFDRELVCHQRHRQVRCCYHLALDSIKLSNSKGVDLVELSNASVVHMIYIMLKVNQISSELFQDPTSFRTQLFKPGSDRCQTGVQLQLKGVIECVRHEFDVNHPCDLYLSRRRRKFVKLPSKDRVKPPHKVRTHLAPFHP